METTIFSSFRTIHPIFCSAAPLNHRKPDSTRKNPVAAQNNWWVPLFGWSSEPDYIGGALRVESGQEGPAAHLKNEPGRVRTEKNLFTGCFTEEKAKELRKKTIESSTFHDIMYHSSIASRLASDV